MRKLLFLILLLPILAKGQAPVSPVVRSTFQNYYEPSTHNNWIWNGSGIWWQAVDSLQLKRNLAKNTTQTYYANLTSGNTLTNSVLQNAVVLTVSRSGWNYYTTASTSPQGNFCYYNPTAGSVKFQDDFNGSGEPVLITYKAVTSSSSGAAGVLTYATMTDITYPIAQNTFIVVNANEDQDGLRWLFYAPAGTSDKSQLQAIASTLNTF